MTGSPVQYSDSVPQPKSSMVVMSGWTLCAAAFLVVLGVINAIHGYTALQHSEYLTTQIVYDNLDFWGWAFIIWGVVQFLAGVFAFGGSSSARFLGASLAAIGMVLWFFMIFAAPFAALVGIGVNLIIIYGMTVPDQVEA